MYCTSGSMFTGTQKKYHKHYNQVLYIVSRIRVQSNVQLHIGINHLAAAALGDCRCPRRFAP